MSVRTTVTHPAYGGTLTLHHVERRFELLIAGRRDPVLWTGTDGLNACHRYADAHPGSAVTAWREAPVYVVTVHPSQIIG